MNMPTKNGPSMFINLEYYKNMCNHLYAHRYYQDSWLAKHYMYCRILRDKATLSYNDPYHLSCTIFLYIVISITLYNCDGIVASRVLYYVLLVTFIVTFSVKC